MKNHATLKSLLACLTICFFFISIPVFAQQQAGAGKIAQKVFAFKQNNSFAKETALFAVALGKSNSGEIAKSVKKFTVLNIISVPEILKSRPSFLSFTVPVDNGRRSFRILLYKESISSNGFTLLSSGGKVNDAGNIVHYKGAVDGDPNSVAAFSFSEDEVTGMINNSEGNFVIGKLHDASGNHIIYNDKDLVDHPVFDCDANTNIPLAPGNFYRGTESTSALTTKCVNWYWETDYDLFTAKGSLANVNTYMQGVFNQVQTLYANDGVSITLKTLYVWTTEDPFTGTSTSGYLDQFGVTRTSFDGDLATLIGTKGGGGIAWINGLCNSQTKYKMAYCGISTNYSTVPTYSWTVECITHEQGHLLGSRHTHDCAWNGNNTKIDGCGDNAGYVSGTCANPGNPAGGGTIMSYCHLTNVGINFNLGFGPQPKALIVNNVNASTCLTNCSSGCTSPDQPAAITGNTVICAASSQTYSITAIAGAIAYVWTLPAGWGGSSTTNSINITAGTTAGNISVTATNNCGSSTARILAVSTLSVPAQPGNISGNAAVCAGTSQTYSIAVVAGAGSYTWTLPSGWSGSSTSNLINTIAGSSAGNITVNANNSCGSSAVNTLSLSITASSPAQPAAISGAVTVCPATSQTYSVNAIAGASSYAWTLPSGWSGSSTTNSITVNTGSTAGTISVSSVNGCGTSAPRSLAVSVGGNAPASPGSITVSGGTVNVCTGDVRTYTVAQVAGQTYNWVAPAGTIINTGQGTNSISLSFTASFSSPSSLTVTATNSCGTGPAASLSISKKAINKPGVISVSGGIAKVCSGDTRTYSVNAIAGITYNWTAPAGGNINSGQGTSTVTVTYNANFTASGILSVTANNQCGTSAVRTLTVARNLPASPSAISGSATVCSRSTETYSVPAVTGATAYLWTVPAGAIIQDASNTNSITILWGTSGGNLAVKATNACGNSGSRSLKITIGCTGGLAGTYQQINTNAEIFPNPANDIANVRFYSKENNVYSFTVTDVAGRKLFSEKQTAETGLNIHQLNLSRFTKGSYFILLESKDTKKVLKLNVQ